MPQIDGLEVARRIRARSELEHLNIIMLITADRPGVEARSAELGIDSCLMKPVFPSELLVALGRLISPAKADYRYFKVLQEIHDRLGDSHDAGLEGKAPPSGARILLAEDMLGNQRLTTAILEQRGHKVVVAENGKEAIEAFRNSHFDLVLMDIQMPVMDGFEATALIRKEEAKSGEHVPVVALTARAMRRDEESCL